MSGYPDFRQVQPSPSKIRPPGNQPLSELAIQRLGLKSCDNRAQCRQCEKCGHKQSLSSLATARGGNMVRHSIISVGSAVVLPCSRHSSASVPCARSPARCTTAGVCRRRRKYMPAGTISSPIRNGIRHPHAACLATPSHPGRIAASPPCSRGANRAPIPSSKSWRRRHLHL